MEKSTTKKPQPVRYTIEQFRKDYPTDDACLEKLFQLRFGKLECCPECAVVDAEFRRVQGRRCYQCMECYTQLYPTAGTVFEKTTTPLCSWFYAMFLMVITRNGVAAKELERALGVSYKCAWRMARQIRLLMAGMEVEKLFGEVQIDETYCGGKTERKTGRNNKEKAPVIAMVEKKGRVFAKHVPDVKKKTVYPEIEMRVDKSATIYTDEFKVYTKLNELGYTHETVLHGIKQYSRGPVNTNAAEGFFSQLKRMISGSYIWVSKKHLDLYVKECAFRYNNRHDGNRMFDTMLFYVTCPQKKAS